MVCLLLPGGLENAAFAEQAGIEVTDQLGRTLTLDAPAEHVVTIPMPAAPMLMGIEQGPESLAAMHPESRTAIRAGLLAVVFPESLALPTDVVGRGFMPNVEAVLSLAPDVVVQWGDRGSDLLAPLEAAGLKVAAVRYGQEEDVQAWLTLFGALVNRGARADRLIALREEVRARLQPLEAMADADKPRVLYLFRVKSGLQVAGAGTFNDFSIRLAGGINAARDLSGFKPVNAEQVLAWNPDVILLNTFEPGLAVRVITDDPLLGMTDAARSGRVHLMPIGGYRWDPPSHESPLAWLWLADVLHGPAAGIDLEYEVRRILGVIYGPALTADALDRVLAGLNRDPSVRLASEEARGR